MKYKTILTLLSIFINLSLILVIIIRSPNEQSLQEGLIPFQFFESPSRAGRSLDRSIILLVSCYFLIGLLFTVERYF